MPSRPLYWIVYNIVVLKHYHLPPLLRPSHLPPDTDTMARGTATLALLLCPAPALIAAFRAPPPTALVAPRLLPHGVPRERVGRGGARPAVRVAASARADVPAAATPGDGDEERDTVRVRIWRVLASGEEVSLARLSKLLGVPRGDVASHLVHVEKQARTLQNKKDDWRARRGLPPGARALRLKQRRGPKKEVLVRLV